MKKLISILSLLLFISLLTGCSSVEDKAKEAIVGKWAVVDYYEITTEGQKDTTLTKYMMEKGFLTFNSDGTMSFINGYESTWNFLEYDKEKEQYLYEAGDPPKIIYYIDKNDTNVLIREKEFTGTNLKKHHFGTRSMTLDGLNSISWIGSVPYEGTQVWIYEKN